jgi:hypothetical protein
MLIFGLVKVGFTKRAINPYLWGFIGGRSEKSELGYLK